MNSYKINSNFYREIFLCFIKIIGRFKMLNNGILSGK